METLYEKASLILNPGVYDSGKVYATKPFDGSGDLTFTRASTATRVNASGLIEEVASGVPRLDYTNSTCPKLLLEPQRINLAHYSEQFDNAYWATEPSVQVVTSGSVLNKRGVTSQKLEFISGGLRRLYRTFTYVLGTTYTASIYAKSDGICNLRIRMSDEGTTFGGVNAAFDLINGTVGTVDSGLTANIVSMGDGWYRCSVTGTAISTDDGNLGIWILNSSNAGEGIYIDAIQLEEGAYATSYVKTEAAAVTRVADRAEIENGDDVLPTSYPFTLYVEVDLRGIDDSWVVSLLNRNVNNIYYIVGVNSDNKFAMISRNITLSSIDSDVNATEGTHKLCGVFTDSTLKLFVDGVLLGSETNAQTFNAAANDFLIGQFRINADTGIRNSVKQALVFNSALTDTQAIELTA
jgi:hypothetical protein